MPLQLIFEESAIRDLKRLPAADRERVLLRLEAFSMDQPTKVKKLAGREEYRLRVGDYRVLFTRSGEKATIRRVVHRKDAYR